MMSHEYEHVTGGIGIGISMENKQVILRIVEDGGEEDEFIDVVMGARECQILAEALCQALLLITGRNDGRNRLN